MALTRDGGPTGRGLVDYQDHDVDLGEFTPGKGINGPDSGGGSDAGLDRSQLAAGAVGLSMVYLAWRGSG